VYCAGVRFHVAVDGLCVVGDGSRSLIKAKKWDLRGRFRRTKILLLKQVTEQKGDVMKKVTEKLLVTSATLLAAAPAFAEGAAPSADGSGHGMMALGAGLAIGLAAVGGALAQGKTAAAALDGIARNPVAQPKIFTPMIIGLALIESLVIYAFVIAFFLQNKF
jgi:F-type H+-transporting ATPase subunit c